MQDAYALRCMPQVHGAARNALAYVRSVLEMEANSATDNPLIFPDEEGGLVLSGGNFHGQPVAQVLDLLAIALTDLASISERRIERLVNPDLSDLPAFLTREPGLSSGMMLAQITAAALVSESQGARAPRERGLHPHRGQQGGPRLHGHQRRAEGAPGAARTPRRCSASS